jgi:hypothetical protein
MRLENKIGNHTRVGHSGGNLNNGSKAGVANWNVNNSASNDNRKSIKENFIRKALKFQKKETEGLKRSLASYYGWLVHCNSYNLRTKYLRDDLFSSSKKQERAA